MKRIAKPTVVFLLGMAFFLAVFAAPAFGAAWHISPNGSDVTGDGTPSNPFATIQHGINAAADGDTVLVAQGTYDENVEIVGKSLSLLGGYEDVGWTRDIPSYVTVIDGGNIASSLLVNSPVLVEGFTIRNGQAAEQGAGGVEIHGGPSEIRYCTLTNNSGVGLDEWGAGGILAGGDCGTIRITGCVVVNNHSTGGAGGIRSGGCELIMEDTLVAHNTGKSGIHLNSSTGSLRNCTIAHNPNGGVLFNQSPVALTNCIVWANHWNNYGPCTITYSDIQGGFPGQGNIVLKPLFCDPGNSVFTLAENSPCLGSGEGGANMGAFGAGCGAILPSYPAPRFQVALVFSSHNANGSTTTDFYARISGPSPEDVASFTVAGPSGTFNLNSSLSFRQLGLYYYHSEGSIINDGTYTFQVTDSHSRSATVVRDFTYNGTLPPVNSTTMSPADGAYVGTTTPTLSFSPVAGVVYYEVLVLDHDSKAIWYRSPKTTATSFTVPSGLLQPNTAYKWDARVWDSATNPQNRHVSNRLYFYTGTAATPVLDMGGVLSLPWSGNLLNFFYSRGINVAPWDISYFRVTGPPPGSVVYNLADRRDYGFQFPAYNSNATFLSPPTQSIPDGIYTIEIEDNSGHAAIPITRSYAYNPVPEFSADTRVPADNAYFDTDTPSFSWARITGDPGDGSYRYSIRIEDYANKIKWYESPYSADTSFTLPTDLNLPRGSSYKWQVRAIGPAGSGGTDSNNYRDLGFRTFTINALSPNLVPVSSLLLLNN